MSHELKQAEYEQAIDDLVTTHVIDESNLAAAFNHYSDDELINLIIAGKKFIRLTDGDSGYRSVEIEQIHIDIANDFDFTMRLIELAVNDKEKVSELVDKRVRAIIKCEIAQIKLDWFDLLTGA